MLDWLIIGALALGRVTGPRADVSQLREQPTRKRLLGLIQRRPGIHASELTREVDESWGTVQYHLSLLRKADLVDSVETGRERRFFPSGVDPQKARLFSLMTQGRRAEVAQFIRDHPGARQVDVCDALDVSRKTFRNSIRPLVDEGFVEEQRGLQTNRYFAAPAVDSFVEDDPSLN